MTSLKERMRRYLFPTRDESIEDIERMQKDGRAKLKLLGFSIGDTVYLEGKCKVVIIDVLSDIYGYVPHLSLRVKASGKDAYEYTKIELYQLNDWVIFPCTIDDIEKSPTDYEKWTKENFIKAIQNSEATHEIHHLFSKMQKRKFD